MTYGKKNIYTGCIKYKIYAHCIKTKYSRFQCKVKGGGMWGGHLNVPVDLYLIQNYYIELRIFLTKKKSTAI